MLIDLVLWNEALRWFDSRRGRDFVWDWYLLSNTRNVGSYLFETNILFRMPEAVGGIEMLTSYPYIDCMTHECESVISWEVLASRGLFHS